FLLAQLVPLLQHGGLERTVLGLLRRQLGKRRGALGVPKLVQVLLLLLLLFLFFLGFRRWHLRLGRLEQGYSLHGNLQPLSRRALHLFLRHVFHGAVGDVIQPALEV
ncbi:Os02g0793150, partial [Oryza sativa Japonica Group]